MSRFKNFAVVTLVSMLIWLWAEVSVFNDRRNSGTEELELSAVPVLVAGESATLARVYVTPDVTTISGLRVRGPRGVIDDIRSGKIRPVVYVTLTDVDAAVDRALLLGDVGPANLGLTLEGLPPQIGVRIGKRQ